jgi:hypothetical protein
VEILSAILTRGLLKVFRFSAHGEMNFFLFEESIRACGLGSLGFQIYDTVQAKGRMQHESLYES